MRSSLRHVVPGLLAAVTFLLPVSSFATPTVVFSTNFDSGLPSAFSAPGSVLEGVQGYAGLGPVGRQFGGNFLRYTSVPILPTTLTLRGLPAHDHLSVKFLLGVIDSWDGTELMQVYVNGSLKFNHWFQLATGDTTDYYPAPAGGILSMGRDLGFSGCCYYNRDRAYDLGVEPNLLNIPHTADSVVVMWTISAIAGPAADQWQGGSDESWAIDALSVEVSTLNTGVGDLAGDRLSVIATPNPQPRGAIRLQLSLPASGPARVELLDLAGRRVASQDLDAAGGGHQSVELSIPRQVASGLFFARVTQSRQTRTTRVIVTD